MIMQVGLLVTYSYRIKKTKKSEINISRENCIGCVLSWDYVNSFVILISANIVFTNCIDFWRKVS